jgi:hypothetical protein
LLGGRMNMEEGEINRVNMEEGGVPKKGREEKE